MEELRKDSFFEVLRELKKITSDDKKICPCCCYYAGRPKPPIRGSLNPDESEAEKLSALTLCFIVNRRQWNMAKFRLYSTRAVWPQLMVMEDRFPRTSKEKFREKKRWERLARLRKFRNRHEPPILIF